MDTCRIKKYMLQMPKSLSFRNEAICDIIDTQRMDKGDEQMCIRFNEMMNKQKDENKRGEANIRDHARIQKGNV